MLSPPGQFFNLLGLGRLGSYVGQYHVREVSDVNGRTLAEVRYRKENQVGTVRKKARRVQMLVS